MAEKPLSPVSQTVWKAIHAIAAQKYRNPCTRLLLDINAACDAAIADLFEIRRRHDPEEAKRQPELETFMSNEHWHDATPVGSAYEVQMNGAGKVRHRPFPASDPTRAVSSDEPWHPGHPPGK